MGEPVSGVGIGRLDLCAIDVGGLRQHFLHGLGLGDIRCLCPRNHIGHGCRRTTEARPEHGYRQDRANGGGHHPKTCVF